MLYPGLSNSKAILVTATLYYNILNTTENLKKYRKFKISYYIRLNSGNIELLLVAAHKVTHKQLFFKLEETC